MEPIGFIALVAACIAFACAIYVGCILYSLCKWMTEWYQTIEARLGALESPCDGWPEEPLCCPTCGQEVEAPE